MRIIFGDLPLGVDFVFDGEVLLLNQNGVEEGIENGRAFEEVFEKMCCSQFRGRNNTELSLQLVNVSKLVGE